MDIWKELNNKNTILNFFLKNANVESRSEGEEFLSGCKFYLCSISTHRIKCRNEKF